MREVELVAVVAVVAVVVVVVANVAVVHAGMLSMRWKVAVAAAVLWSGRQGRPWSDYPPWLLRTGGVVAGVEDKRAEVEGVGVTVEGCEGIIVCVCCGVVEV